MTSIVDPPEAGGKGFLLAEYTSYQSAFAKNEELGERRVQFFLGLVAAALGAIGLMTTVEKGPIVRHPELIPVIGFSFSLLLLVTGFLTYDRLLKRDETTSEYLSVLDEIRRRFVRSDREGNLVRLLDGYNPFPELKPKRLQRIGRLSRLIFVVNAWVAGVAAIFGRVSLTGWPKDQTATIAAAAYAVFGSAAVLFAQWVWWKRKYWARP